MHTPVLFAEIEKKIDEANALRRRDPRVAFGMGKNLRDESAAAGYRKGEAEALLVQGWSTYYRNDYPEAIFFSREAIDLFTELEHHDGVMRGLLLQGWSLSRTGRYPESAKALERSLAMAEEHDNVFQQCAARNALGDVFTAIGRGKDALALYEQNIAYYEKTNDELQLANTYNNMSNSLLDLKRFNKIIRLLNYCCEVYARRDEQLFLANSLATLGKTYLVARRYAEAEKPLQQAMKIYRRNNQFFGTMNCLKFYADVAIGLGNYDQALRYTRRGRVLARRLGSPPLLLLLCDSEAAVYEKRGEWEKALNVMRERSRIEQAYFEKKVSDQITAARTGFELEKKARESEIFRLRNIELARLNSEIGEKNKEILDSISYAQRIQEAMLPRMSELRKVFGDAFVFFHPRDIVSGDFFWLQERESLVYFAVADCTGHGVPGGFMSMLGNSLLNESVNDTSRSRPDTMLDHLRHKLISTLRQRGESGETKDGMDMVLGRYDRDSGELLFACANNPLWLVRGGELREFPADKMPVGVHHGEIQPFRLQRLKAEPGDMIYLFTDGFADQFGGEKGKKFMYRRLRETLVAIADQPCADQQQHLENTFIGWKGNLRQVDDVLVMGIRLQ